MAPATISPTGRPCTITSAWPPVTRKAAVATAPWSKRQSPGSSSRSRATARIWAWSATEKLLEEVVGVTRPRGRVRFVVSLPVSRSTVMSPPPCPGPHRCFNWNALHTLYSTLHTLGASLFLVTTATDARDTRDRILDATVRLLRRQGYTATGIKQIVAEADAPLGSIYHYFPGGKEQIGAEALVRAGERTRRTIAQAADLPDLPAVINNFFVYNAERLRDSDYAQGCPIATVALETASDNERIRKVCEDAFHGWQATLAGVFVDAGIAEVDAAPLRHVRALELRGRAHHEPRPARHPADAHERRRSGIRARRASRRHASRRLTPPARETPVSCSKRDSGQRSASRR